MCLIVCQVVKCLIMCKVLMCLIVCKVLMHNSQAVPLNWIQASNSTQCLSFNSFILVHVSIHRLSYMYVWSVNLDSVIWIQASNPTQCLSLTSFIFSTCHHVQSESMQWQFEEYYLNPETGIPTKCCWPLHWYTCTNMHSLCNDNLGNIIQI